MYNSHHKRKQKKRKEKKRKKSRSTRSLPKLAMYAAVYICTDLLRFSFFFLFFSSFLLSFFVVALRTRRCRASSTPSRSARCDVMRCDAKRGRSPRGRWSAVQSGFGLAATRSLALGVRGDMCGEHTTELGRSRQARAGRLRVPPSSAVAAVVVVSIRGSRPNGNRGSGVLQEECGGRSALRVCTSSPHWTLDALLPDLPDPTPSFPPGVLRSAHLPPPPVPAAFLKGSGPDRGVQRKSVAHAHAHTHTRAPRSFRSGKPRSSPPPNVSTVPALSSLSSLSSHPPPFRP